MKRIIKKSVALSLCVLLLLLSVIYASASETSGVKVSIENTDEAYIITFSVSAPEDISSVDMSCTYNSEVFTSATAHTSDTDAEKFTNEIPEAPDINETYYIYDYIIEDGKLRYSGFFTDSFKENSDTFSFLVLKLKKGENDAVLNESITVSAAVSDGLQSVTKNTVYSLLSGDVITSDSVIKEHFMGDIDMDNKVSAADARKALRYSVGLEEIPLEAVMYANPDFDNKISAADARIILRTAVGLEKQTAHNFEVTLIDSESCEEGGTYRFHCTVTEKNFTLNIKNGGHILTEPDCFLPVCCTVCGETIEEAKGHSFDTDGICTICGITKEETEKIKEALLPMFESITFSDSEAYAAAEKGDLKGYFKNITESVLLLKKAIAICGDNPYFTNIKTSLEAAYDLRYNAFLHCTDEDGNISITRKNFNYIHSAVNKSNVYIDSAAVTFRNSEE